MRSFPSTSLFSSNATDPNLPPLPLDTLITDKDLAEFSLIGNSSAIANMSVGVLKLDPIKVNVTTSLQGLQGLNNMVKINSVDVTGGTKDAIVLDIDGETRLMLTENMC